MAIGVDHNRAKSACWREGRNWRGGRSGKCNGDAPMQLRTKMPAPTVGAPTSDLLHGEMKGYHLLRMHHASAEAFTTPSSLTP